MDSRLRGNDGCRDTSRYTLYQFLTFSYSFVIEYSLFLTYPLIVDLSSIPLKAAG